MKKKVLNSWFLLLFLLFASLHAQGQVTHRVEQFTNNKVKVWKTIIYPSSKKTLPMHRHDHNRVLVALSDGVLKVTNNKGKVHFLKLEKDTAYYLTKDIPDELHNDQNVTKYPIKVMVIELN